jgi:tetratricopeptide (TPR) repeat protein
VSKLRAQPQVWAALGECYEATNRLNEAKEAYQTALSISGKYDFALLRLGLLLARQNELDEADERLAAVLELDPSLAEALAVRGAIAARRGQLDRARELYTLAQKAKPNKVPPSATRGIEVLDFYRKQVLAEYDELQKQYIEEDQPTVAECFFNAALALVKRNDLGRAYSAFLTAHDEDSGWSEPMMWMGILDAVQNRPSDARGHLEEALKADDQNGFIPEAIGVICLALGHTKEADKQFEAARKLGRDVPEVK